MRGKTRNFRRVQGPAPQGHPQASLAARLQARGLTTAAVPAGASRMPAAQPGMRPPVPRAPNGQGRLPVQAIIQQQTLDLIARGLADLNRTLQVGMGIEDQSARIAELDQHLQQCGDRIAMLENENTQLRQMLDGRGIQHEVQAPSPNHASVGSILQQPHPVVGPPRVQEELGRQEVTAPEESPGADSSS